MLVAVTNKHSLQFTTEWFDYFPTTVNNTTCNELIIQAAEANGFTLYQKPHPFKFGEDFGWFSQHYKTAMFGIGAGVDSPALHHADYDFPNALLESGIRMFMEIGKRLLMRGSSGY
jgi:metal-dependent amidase/aminoacylase/carboxypeptidase family protein